MWKSSLQNFNQNCVDNAPFINECVIYNTIMIRLGWEK